MITWKVAAISNAHGSVYAQSPTDSIAVAFASDEIVLSCVFAGDACARMTMDLRGIRLGHDHYELVIPEAVRRAVLESYSRDQVLDRSWVEDGEPEVWRLELRDHVDFCGVGRRSIQLALR